MHIGHHGRTYSRTAYTISSLISNVGGLIGSLYGMLAILLLPYSYFSFVLHAASQLFFAKTKENEFFENDNDPITEAFLESSLFTNNEKDEFFLHRPIFINFKNTMMLYFSWFKCCCSSDTLEIVNKMQYLYENAEHKLAASLNVVSLIK